MISEQQHKIALLLKVRPGDLREINAEEVREHLKGRIHPHVLEVAGDVSGARFWRLGGKVFFDDPEEQEEAPLPFEDLRYDSEIGLHSIHDI